MHEGGEHGDTGTIHQIPIIIHNMHVHLHTPHLLQSLNNQASGYIKSGTRTSFPATMHNPSVSNARLDLNNFSIVLDMITSSSDNLSQAVMNDQIMRIPHAPTTTTRTTRTAPHAIQRQRSHPAEFHTQLQIPLSRSIHGRFHRLARHMRQNACPTQTTFERTECVEFQLDGTSRVHWTAVEPFAGFEGIANEIPFVAGKVGAIHGRSSHFD
jgi:hypothetical protein